MPDSEFKLIAIKPLEDCKEEYHKILTKGHTYFFYQNYKIGESENLEKTSESVPHNLFSEDNPIIEISAIVGKNGSGKSTLMELFIMAINNYACQFKNKLHRLVFIKGLHVVIYFKFNGFRKLIATDEGVSIFKYSVRSKQMVLDAEPKLEPFFYTIAVNYSHYAYNDLDYTKDQQWLTEVFHKNDGYQIPIVLNPFRTHGNIDINSENHLIKARLMANLLRPSTDGDFDFRNLTEKHRAVYLKLTLNKNKTAGVLYVGTKNDKNEAVRLKDLDIDRELILGTLNKLYPFGYKKNLQKDNKVAIDYILYKLVTICLRYPDYIVFFDAENKSFRPKVIPAYLEKIIEDPSHIAYKLKQTLNFIRYGYIPAKSQRLDLDKYGKIIYDIMSQKKSVTGELVELLPPPIFKIDIMVKDKNNGRISPFSGLSSGEKQWNYAVSSFLYHLNNLESIPPKRNRVTYSRAFLILEEIELYFHPEMQRRYVQHLIDSIKQMHFHRIKRLQICLITHSPFILSDIPEQNILFLGSNGLPVGSENITKTFGGNIHDLLAKSFFLDEALVGEFARRKIKELIRHVQPEKNTQLIERDHTELRKTIDLIGEDYLREKLIEMYDEKFGGNEKERRIKDLEAEIRRLRNDRS